MRITVFRRVRNGSRSGKKNTKELEVREVFRMENDKRIGADIRSMQPIIIECVDKEGTVYAIRDRDGSIGAAMAKGEGPQLTVDITMHKDFIGKSEPIKTIEITPRTAKKK